MDTCSSGEDLLLKTRKPYTMTKQREKWTDEEHDRFLEAVKLYGRAWQRIEEHIGTKTAVQIRSHAQKFFSKLEKEALVKGVPLGQAHGIEIPPPRPKRKPATPYPRKTNASCSPRLAQNNFLNSISRSHQKNSSDNGSRVDLDSFDELNIDTQIRLAPPNKADGSGSVKEYINAKANSSCSGLTLETTTEKITGHSTLSTAPLFNISSAFSELIISSLMQNPTAYATATLAASLWPGTRMDGSQDATSAVTTATMAAAWAWWSIHGVLPFCPAAGVYQFPPAERYQTGGRSRSPTAASSSDSEENQTCRANLVGAEPGKKADRSSCGSNTPSSSDVETDPAAAFSKGELGQAHMSSWKAVSQEGRMAFQALFSREVLPQSFSPPQDEEGEKQRKITGFKPYKRCSVKAKIAGPAAASREENMKRIRLERIGEGGAVPS